jgi:hypothetical protein
VDERLKRYEALLRQNGINPDQATGGSEVEQQSNDRPSEDAPDSASVETPKSDFKPHLVHGPTGTTLVHK